MGYMAREGLYVTFTLRVATFVRVCGAAGAAYSEDGELIISETEYEQMNKVRELKSDYRERFEELRGVKAEVHYCQRLVDQCRQRLIQGHY